MQGLLGNGWADGGGDGLSGRLFFSQLINFTQETTKNVDLHLVQTNAVEHPPQPGEEPPWIFRVMEVNLHQGALQMLEEVLHSVGVGKGHIPFLRPVNVSEPCLQDFIADDLHRHGKIQ